MRFAGRATKLSIALVVGLPVTIVQGGMNVILTAMLAGEMRWGMSMRDFTDMAVWVLWCAAGWIGLAAFWSWVFTRDRGNPRRNVVMLWGIVAGMLASVPFVFDGGVFALIAALGIGGGLAPCLWLLDPAMASNPDRVPRQEGAGRAT